MKKQATWISRKIFILFTFAVVFTNCQKDDVLLQKKEPVNATKSSGRKVTIKKAQEIYRNTFDKTESNLPPNQFGATDENGCLVFEPIWFLAKEVLMANESSILTVPIKMASDVVTEGRGMQLVFFENDSCSLPMELVIYETQAPSNMDVCSFSGSVVTINYCKCTTLKYDIVNGQIGPFQEISMATLPTCNKGIGERTDPKCYDFGDSFWGNLASWLSGLFGGGGGGGGGGGIVWYNGGIFPYYYGSNPSGGPSGGGGAGVMNSIFDGTFFNGQGQLVLNKMNQVIEQYDLFVCVEDLHIALYHCIATNYNEEDDQCGGFHEGPDDDPNYNPNIDELTIPEYLAFLGNLGANAPDCLAEMQQNYQEEINMGPDDGYLVCLIKEFNEFGIPDQVVYELIQQNGCYVDGVLISDCVEDATLPYVINSLANELGLSTTEVAYLTANPEIAFSMQQFLNSHNHDANAKLAAKNIIHIQQIDRLYGPYPEAQRDAIIAEYNFPTPEQYYQYVTWCGILASQWIEDHPGQQPSNAQMALIAAEAYWKTISGEIHTLLDICGLIPAAGEPCDGVNGVIYLMEGDGVNATFSFAATIPFLGWASTGAKWVRIAVNTAAGVKHLKITKVGSLFEFSHYSSFRSMMGLTDPSVHAHHLIPWGMKNNDTVQKAAQAGSPNFHMNNPNNNGFAIASWRNQPNHNQYDSKIETALLYIKNTYGNSPPDIVSQHLSDFQDYLKQQIQSNPGLHLNDVPISWP